MPVTGGEAQIRAVSSPTWDFSVACAPSAAVRGADVCLSDSTLLRSGQSLVAMNSVWGTAYGALNGMYRTSCSRVRRD